MIHLTAYGKLFATAIGTITACYVLPKMFGAALALETDHLTHMPLVASVRQEWHSCRITTYGMRPSGKPYHGGRTASGARYDDYGWTVAVPPLKKGSRRPMIPYGTLIDLRWQGKTLHGLRVTDICPGCTFDVTRKAMVAILGHYEDTKLRGAEWAKVIPQ